MTGLWPHESADTRSWVRFRRCLHDSPGSVRCRVTWTCDLDRAADLTSVGSRRSALITGDRLFGSGGNRPMSQSRQGPRAASPPVRLTIAARAVTKVDGRLALGEKLSITVKANSRRVFPVEVVTLSGPERMVFRGGMPLGLFTGKRTYTLMSEGTGTRFTMREEYTGPLAGMISKSIPDLGPSFRQFAAGLKHQAE